MRKFVATVALAALASTTVLADAGEAHAQTVNEVSPTGKGIVGCALLGAETVMLIEAAAGARPAWAYILGGVLGAGAGAAGGYFLEQAAEGDTALTGVAIGTLVVGLGVAIPTTIAMLNATTYRPEAEAPTEDASPGAGPVDESTTPGAGAPAEGGAPAPAAAPASGSAPAAGTTSARTPHGTGSRLTAARAFRATGLLDFTEAGMNLAVPALSVGSAVTVAEMRQYGVGSVPELRLPLLSGSF
ncbi:MAG: hypothetical protein U0325_28565 [Polyangiales bacterium]